MKCPSCGNEGFENEMDAATCPCHEKVEQVTQEKVNEGTAKLKALINKWAVYKGSRQ